MDWAEVAHNRYKRWAFVQQSREPSVSVKMQILSLLKKDLELVTNSLHY